MIKTRISVTPCMCWNTLTITPKTRGDDDLIIQSQPHPHLQLFSVGVGGRTCKHLSNNTCSASLLYKGRDSASFCFGGEAHSDGGAEMSACSFSTCSGEQHSQNSFLLPSFFTMLGDVQLILDLCLSCACLLLLSSRRHTVYSDSTFPSHNTTRTQQAGMCVVCTEG